MSCQKILIIMLFLLLNSCKHEPVSVEEGGFYYHHIYFGKNISKDIKQGIEDGCQTAQGNYSKVHKLFNDNKEYQKGWFIGRNRCNI